MDLLIDGRGGSGRPSPPTLWQWRPWFRTPRIPIHPVRFLSFSRMPRVFWERSSEFDYNLRW